MSADPQPPRQPSVPRDAFASVDDSGLSLEDLSAAYAQLIEGGADPYDQEALSEPQHHGEAAAGGPEADGAGEVSPRSILEALLFVGSPHNEPLTSRKVAALMRGVSPREIDELVAELNALYQAEGCPYEIASVGAGYALQLRGEFTSLRDKFYGKVQEARLSQAAIDVLALVAYRQPITADEINSLRGQASGQVLSQLVRRGLLRIERAPDRRDKPRYHTTERLLALFQMRDISELPQSHFASESS